MQPDGTGSSVVIVIAALLWFVYLVPTWLRRREYLATERNAVRLQQTLRILAETAEMPTQVRAETSARSVLAQEKLMKSELRRSAAIASAQDAANARAAARRLAEIRPASLGVAARNAAPHTYIGGSRTPFVEGSHSRRPLVGGFRTPFVEGSRSDRLETPPALLPRPVSSRRLRRSRLLASLVLFAAMVAAGFGVGPVITAPAVLSSWLLLGGGAVVAAGAFVLLGQMAAVARARAELNRFIPIAQPVRMSQPRIPQVQAPAAWTPVPIPKPLYLSRSEAPVAEALEAARRITPAEESPAEVPVVETLEAARAELLAAAAHADTALRAAPRPPSIRPAAAVPAVASSAPSRFARMGVIEESDAGFTNLDDVLRRRRSIAG